MRERHFQRGNLRSGGQHVYGQQLWLPMLLADGFLEVFRGWAIAQSPFCLFFPFQPHF
jgi:hypothetical protein